MYKYIIIFILIGLGTIIFLSRLIFDIDVITNDKKMEKKILIELKNSGLSKYKFKKSYNELQQIKENILNKYTHEIDWIEIENQGTKYIVRYEPRIENKQEKETPLRNIVAKKNSVIYSMDISDGQIIKGKGVYVRKGDIIVSGYIYLNDKITDTVSASGKIYGEVWYTLDITYPLHYYQEKETKNKKDVYSFKIINKNIELFNFNKYKNKKVTSKTILKNNIIPIKLEKQHQQETNIIDKTYNQKQAIKEAIKLGQKKLEKKLKNKEFVMDYKVLEQHISNNELKTKIFYIVCEDITDYQEISEYQEITEES